MSVLTKIATRHAVDFQIFRTENEEMDYLNTLCPFCNSADCNDGCVFTVANAEDCDSCNGKGLIKFLMQPADKGETYFVITECGMCDGIGLI